ncbi:MAG: hypothetical protein V4805_17380 [Pseudomonadota bacterium]
MRPFLFFLQRILVILPFCFLHCLVHAATPELHSVSGVLRDGQTQTIAGSGFSDKTNPKPLLYWHADGGLLPSPLGRKTAWDGTFSGELVEQNVAGAVFAPGSSKSFRHDHGRSEAAILSKVKFQSDRLYVWRKRYDAFDRSKDYAIRTRFNNMVPLQNGATLKLGMLMSTSTSPAANRIWGQIVRLDGVNIAAGTGTAFYSNKVGNVNDAALIKSTKTNDPLYFYDSADTAMTTPLFQAGLNEGVGIFHTFNYKVMRLWGEYGNPNGGNNSYIGLGFDAAFVSEYTQLGTFLGRDWDHRIEAAQYRWVIEEMEYKDGTVDVADGSFLFWQNRLQAWANKGFRFKRSILTSNLNRLDMPYSDLFQAQTSNGAQDGSYEYFDTLYVDDSLHRAVLCKEPTWSTCKDPEVQIPVQWSDTSIKLTLRLGGLRQTSTLYLYVLNKDGVANEVGKRLSRPGPFSPLLLLL